MTTKPTATAKQPVIVKVRAAKPGESKAESLARLSADGILPLAFTAEMFARNLAGGDCDLMTMFDRMLEVGQDVTTGKMEPMERMLSAQAQTLNLMFTELTRRAALNMGQHLPATEAYLRLALKAQAQSRATVEALAEMKNPRAVAFVKQANIANQQQVNNGPAPNSNGKYRSGEAVPRAGKFDKPEIELLEDAHHEQGQRMDAGTQAAAARSDSTLEAVGTVHGSKDAGGQGT